MVLNERHHKTVCVNLACMWLVEIELPGNSVVEYCLCDRHTVEYQSAVHNCTTFNISLYFINYEAGSKRNICKRDNRFFLFNRSCDTVSVYTDFKRYGEH